MKKKVLSAFALSLLLFSCSGGGEGGKEPLTADQVLSQVQECSRIYTSEYQVNKVIVHEDEKRIAGRLAGMKINLGIAGTDRMIAIPIDGVLKGYVDMSQITADKIQVTEDHIEITLPEPKIALTSTSINHKDIQEDVSLLRSGFNDKELTRIQLQGRDSLIASIPRLGILPQVKVSTERTLVSLLTQMGYTKEQIKINFTNSVNNPTLDDIKAMFVDETIN